MGQAIITRRGGGGSPQKKQAYVHSQNANIGTGTSMTVSLLSCDDGDLMLAYFMCRSANTLPTGWTQIFVYSFTTGSDTQYIAAAYKIKSSIDSANFTVTQSAGTRIGAQIFCVKNAGMPYDLGISTLTSVSESGYVLPNTQTDDAVIWGLHSYTLATEATEYVLVEPSVIPAYHCLSRADPVGDGKNRLVTLFDNLGSDVSKKIYRPNNPYNVVQDRSIQIVAVGIPYSA